MSQNNTNKDKGAEILSSLSLPAHLAAPSSS